MKKLVMLFALLLMALVGYAQSVPMLINYQARLQDNSSNPIIGNNEVTFRLYVSLTGGTMIWEETHFLLVSDDGIISVLLGSVTTFDNAIFSGSSLFLETEVTGYGILSPRQQLTSVPYAIKAENTTRFIGEFSGSTIYGETVTVYDETFPANSISDYISGYINYDTSNNDYIISSTIHFGIAGNEDQIISVSGGDIIGSGRFNPQSLFFFQIKPAYESELLRLYITITGIDGDDVMGKVWGQ